MKPYPDFDLESPSPQPLGSDGDYAGYSEYRLKEAIEDLIRQCGGNRFIAHGRAVEMVSEVTGVRNASVS